MTAPLPKITVTCVICGCEFEKTAGIQKMYCGSRKCRYAYQKSKYGTRPAQRKEPPQREEFACIICGEKFERHPKSNKLTCSKECAAKNHARNNKHNSMFFRAGSGHKAKDPNKAPDGTCRWCGKPFVKSAHNQTVCSFECFRAYDTARQRANRRVKPQAKPKPAPIVFTHTRPYIRCIRSNDLYAAGMEYERGMVIKDIRAGEVAHQDFAL